MCIHTLVVNINMKYCIWEHSCTTNTSKHTKLLNYWNKVLDRLNLNKNCKCQPFFPAEEIGRNMKVVLWYLMFRIIFFFSKERFHIFNSYRNWIFIIQYLENIVYFDVCVCSMQYAYTFLVSFPFGSVVGNKIFIL